MIDLDAIERENLRCPPGGITAELIDLLRTDNAIGLLVAVVRKAQRFADVVIEATDYDDEQAVAADELIAALAELGAA